MFIFTKGTSKLPVLLVAMLTLVALSVACSGDTVVETVIQTVIVEKEVKGDTVVETVIVEKEVKGDTVVQTVVVAATAIPVPTAAPTPVGGPRGTFRYAATRVIPPLFVPALGGVGHEQDYASYGMVEFLMYADHGTENYNPEKSIAISWDLADDLSKVRFTLRNGIPFHKGWGELTAADVAWSMNSAIRDGSTFWGAGGLQQWMDRWEVVDDYTVDLFFIDYNSNWQFLLSNLATHQPWIYPKKAVDELGEDRANVTPLGTGPFENVLYRTDDMVVVEAFNGGDHWRAKPGVERIEVLQIPEPLVRNAAFKVGEVDIIEVLNKDIGQLAADVPGSYEQAARGTGWPHVIYYTGNYWGDALCDADPDTSWKHDAEYPRPGFKPDSDHPWIGDPSGVGNSMESALKVRQAMNMAIDRDAILDSVFGGLGESTAAYNGFLPSDDEWNDAWNVEFDLPAAKALLADAGYPNGFSFEFYFPPDHIVMNVEAGAAIGQMWRELGLDVKIDNAAYATARPRHFKGVDDIIWYAHSGTGKLDKQKAGAYGPSNTFHGAELPCDMQALYWANATEVDKDQRIQNNIEMQNYISEWSLQLPFASITDYWMVGPNIKAWSPHKIAGRYFTNPETVQVK
jgi:ABC-type transport system substrate-binding protein